MPPHSRHLRDSRENSSTPTLPSPGFPGNKEIPLSFCAFRAFSFCVPVIISSLHQMPSRWFSGRAFWEVEERRERGLHRCLHLRCNSSLVMSVFTLPRKSCGHLESVLTCFSTSEKRRREKIDASCYTPSLRTSQASRRLVSLSDLTCVWKGTKVSPYVFCLRHSVSRLVAPRTNSLCAALHRQRSLCHTCTHTP